MSQQPTTEELFTKVQALIVDQLGVSEKDVTMEANIRQDLGADSLDDVELVMALEEEFAMEIPDAEAEQLSTVGDIVRFIEKYNAA